ncbi:DUF421 domain-containing protein [Crassaminicella thermophila]|uniref:DUF421 domain-containing protein n=1 Tax=Crassaminicella thermophila TaxID=2599308 RepID=A0A5C0SKH4_CRATE|nr:DUF421 domain-containing protein [Crassaminicella thermophila]QEK13688.1 DUF421 domain-containing protein [Crassaminicella thermophila]
MVIIFIRTLLLYLFVLLSLRMMGKGTLSEMQPFELVIIFMIAELASLPMEDTAIPLINGFISIAALLIIQVIISYISLKSEKARSILSGKPSILINKGIVNEKELRRLRININDLVEQLRLKDYHNMADVEFAILETNGDLSVIPKSNKKPVTIEDINKKGSYDGIPVFVIIDGHINKENLEKINCTKDWLLSQLKSKGVKNPKDILYCYVDTNKEIYIQKKVKV